MTGETTKIGDAGHEAEMVKFCRAAARAALRRYPGLGSIQDEDDVAHDVFLRLHGRPGIHSPRLAAWKTARNLVVDALRANPPSRPIDFDELAAPARPGPEAEAEAEAEAGTGGITPAAARLALLRPDLSRVETAIIDYCLADGVELGDSKTIARGTGLTAGAVSSAVYRLRRRSRPALPSVEQFEDRW